MSNTGLPHVTKDFKTPDYFSAFREGLGTSQIVDGTFLVNISCYQRFFWHNVYYLLWFQRSQSPAQLLIACSTAGNRKLGRGSGNKATI